MSQNQRLPVVKAAPGWFTSALRAGLCLLGALCLFVCLFVCLTENEITPQSGSLLLS